jgi:uncharacterized protein YaaQ
MKTPTIHYLMLAVVQEQDTERVMRTLGQMEAPVVNLTSTGGFLGRRNATLLIGLPEGMEEQVLEALRTSCHRRTEYMTMPLEGSSLPLPTPVPVNVGGATVFCILVDQFEEF